MSQTIQLVLASVACGIVFLLQYPAGLISSKLAAVTSFGALAGLMVWERTTIDRRRPADPFLCLAAAFAALFLIVRQILDLDESNKIGQLYRNLTTIVTFVYLARRSQDLGKCFTGLGVAITTYAALNVLLSRKYGVSEMAGHVRASGDGLRMLAPFSNGLVTFACVAGLGFGAAVIGLRQNLRNKWMAVLNLFSVLICAYAIWAAEMRAALILVLIVPMLLWNGRFAKSGLWFSFLGMCGLPLLYYNMWIVPHAYKWIPDMVGNFSRYSGDIVLLTGRAYIYDYGFSLIQSYHFPFFGVGFASRDAVPILEFMGLMESVDWNFTFHNGMIELLVVNGVFLGAAFILLFGLICLRVSKDGQGWGAASERTIVLSTFLSCAFFLAWTAAFVNEPFFWGVSAFCLAARRRSMIASLKAAKRPQVLLPYMRSGVSRGV